MTMLIAKWGNSLAILLPVSLVEALELREGDEIEVTVDGPRLFTVRKKLGLLATLDRLRFFRGRLPADFKFHRDEANGH
ncbi:AbrB/MazE/SpoVT family DNA-binding domain-containing protein [Xanthomonas phaseoli]|uniref:AbrB/MazE/SpoVT family DNA-binding domain-containing protein n=1 Tax=Xanthomonas phaseoli TaxID=1985254 RepID=UPI003AFFB0DA